MLQKFFIIFTILWFLNDISNWDRKNITKKRRIFKAGSCFFIYMYSFFLANEALKYSKDNLSTFYSTCLSVVLMFILKKNINKINANKLYFKKLEKYKKVLFELIEEKNFDNLSVVWMLSFRYIKFSIFKIKGYDGLSVINIVNSVIAIIFIIWEAFVNFDIVFITSNELYIMRKITLTLIIFIFLSTLLAWIGSKISASIGVFFKFFRYFRNGIISCLFNKR